MEMTSQQLATLKAAIQADSNLTALVAASQYGEIANYYNQTASPAFVVWKTRVSQDEIMQNGFDWVQVDNLSAGKARIWEWLFDNSSASINPSKDNVRAGIAECWKGTSAMLAVQAVVLGHCKRNANRIEKLFATGTGSDAAPAKLVLEGAVTNLDIAQALAS